MRTGIYRGSSARVRGRGSRSQLVREEHGRLELWSCGGIVVVRLSRAPLVVCARGGGGGGRSTRSLSSTRTQGSTSSLASYPHAVINSNSFPSDSTRSIDAKRIRRT